MLTIVNRHIGLTNQINETFYTNTVHCIIILAFGWYSSNFM